MVKNRKCYCCGEKYSYCPDCSKKDALAPTWKSEFCSETCKDLWQTATRYNMNKISKTEAKSIISKLDLKPVEQYSSCIQRDLGVILAKDPKPKRTKKVESPVVDEALTVTVNAEIKEITNDEVVVEIEVPVLSDESHEVVNKTEE